METNDMTPLKWLLQLDTNERDNVISWFNHRMDTLMHEHNFMQYNNPSNSLIDVIHEIMTLAQVTIAPDINSASEDYKHFISIISDKDDIYKLVYQYCLTKFDKTIRQDKELQSIIKHNIHGSYPKFNDMQSHDNRKHNRFHDRYRNW